MARLINYFELKQRILEERDKIPKTLPSAIYEFGIEKPNHHGNSMRGGIRIALRCLEQCQTVMDTVEVVRCKDCEYFKPAHFKADDGTETPWDETFNWDDRSDGIYLGGKCKHERNTAYGQKDMAFRKPDDFCSYGERRTDG